MSSVQDLIDLAEYDRQSNELSNPLFGLARGMGAGMQQGVVDQYEKRKQEEATKTGFAKLLQIMNGTEKDYQNKYKIKPTFDSKTGSVGGTLVEKSDADQFSQAVQSGSNPFQLRLQFPQFADQIDKLEISGVFNPGTRIQPAPMGAIIPPANVPQGTSIPSPMQSQTAQTGPQIVPSGWDALGRPKGYEVQKPDAALLKFNAEQADEKKQKEMKSQMVKDSAQETLKTIQEIKNGIKFFGAAGAIPPIPGEYDKVNWRANFDSLVSQRVIDVMTKMKEASKTGATGFGQLSNKELEVLQNASTKLKRVMSEEDAKRYLDDMETVVKKVLQPSAQSGQTNNQQSSASSGFLEGKTYRDAQGNRAVYQGGKFVPAQ